MFDGDEGIRAGFGRNERHGGSRGRVVHASALQTAVPVQRDHHRGVVLALIDGDGRERILLVAIEVELGGGGKDRHGFEVAVSERDGLGIGLKGFASDRLDVTVKVVLTLVFPLELLHERKLVLREIASTTKATVVVAAAAVKQEKSE